MPQIDSSLYAKFLPAWLAAAQQHIYRIPQRPDLACYGPGYNNWGVQTNQKAFSAFAVAAADPSLDWSGSPLAWDQVLEQALAMLRFSLESHHAGSWLCNDGEKWGHTWISGLGLERMMHGVEAIWQQLIRQDHDLLRKVLVSEANWLMNDYEIRAGLVENNRPESNIWNSALLERVALYYPDLPDASSYRAQAEDILSLQARGQDGKEYLLLFNTGPTGQVLDLAGAACLDGTFSGQLAAGQAVLLQLD